MFELLFLGTSAAVPSVHRGLSAAAVLAGEDRFLVDCGEGTQRQILRSGLGFKRLNRILITHPHLDHLLGIGGIVSTFTRWETLQDIHIWGSWPTLARVRSLIFDVVLRDQTPPIPINLNLVEEGVIYTGNGFRVRAFPVTHRGAGCFGYLFEQDTHYPFLPEKATALGIPFGPERGQLVRGESITLADGRTITPDMVLGEPIQGVRVAFTGDIARTDNLLEVLAGVDVLVTEATFLEADRQSANDYGHITAHQAATFARDAGIHSLLITHVSRRYRERDIIHEARAVFPSAHVVRDMDAFTIKRGEPLERKVITEPNEETEGET